MRPGKVEIAFMSVFGRRSTQTESELVIQGITWLKSKQESRVFYLCELHAKGMLAVAYLVCLKPRDSQFIFSTSQALMFPGQQTQF